MSEPMSSVEIEDVLSSIRRLVSEDLRPASRPALTPKPDTGDKLILTPAFRVVEVQKAEDADNDRSPTPGPQVDAQVPEFAMDEKATAGHDCAPSSNLRSILDGVFTQRSGGKGDDLFEDAVLPHPAETAREPSTIGAVVAVVGAAVTENDWEAETDAPCVAEADWDGEGWQMIRPDGIVAVEAPAVVEVEGVEPATGPHEAWGADDMWTQETSNTAIVPSGDTPKTFHAAFEAVATGVAEDQVSAARADQAEAEAVAEILGAEVFESGAASVGHGRRLTGVSVFDAEETAIDEDLLRDLVRDIIREELQGALGQRITRNVRKLVRAEINRALTSQDFE